MAEKPVGLTFDETMAGGFAMGETDPEAGRLAGEREGSELSMHASVAIDDLAAFVDAPDHRGRLSGTIDFTPFGAGLHAPHGVFNLFCPSDEPALKLMVYELGFEHGGKAYYLAGRKHVRDAPVTELWKATTTLYTTLHEGADASGPVVGAGVLTLSVKELIALVSTMRVTGAESPAAEARALARFGGFFMGDLWDTYARHRAR